MGARKALALLASGHWQAAHEVVQDDPSPEAAWVHAHLHRIEGDLANARYWYGRAGRPEPTVSIEEERERMMRELPETAR